MFYVTNAHKNLEVDNIVSHVEKVFSRRMVAVLKNAPANSSHTMIKLACNALQNVINVLDLMMALAWDVLIVIYYLIVAPVTNTVQLANLIKTNTVLMVKNARVSKDADCAPKQDSAICVSLTGKDNLTANGPTIFPLISSSSLFCRLWLF